MGKGLALNLASKGHRVAIYNKEVDRISEVLQEARSQSINTVRGFDTVRGFVSSLERPKKILMMVPAGNAVDDVLASMKPYLQPGDIVIDGGNEWYKNTEERQKMLMKVSGVQLVGMGVSGGSKGAREGAAFMPGGDPSAVEQIMHFVRDMSDAMSTPTYIGARGSGHFVKTVHNGIEYALMQIIAEAYDILKNHYMLENATIATFFRECNKDLDSFLLDITCDILSTEDDDGLPLIGKILDASNMKGTGVWTVKESFDTLVACPSITTAIQERIISKDKVSRVVLSHMCRQPMMRCSIPSEDFMESHEAFLIKNVMRTCMLISYLQGFELMHAKSTQEQWCTDVQRVAAVWMGGCIIRSRLLMLFQIVEPSQYKKEMFMMVAPHYEVFVEFMSRAALVRLRTPVMAATFQYILSWTHAYCPANLIQAQRDFFGAHGYERVDKHGTFTTKWTS